jgi:hypothetical protein
MVFKISNAFSMATISLSSPALHGTESWPNVRARRPPLNSCMHDCFGKQQLMRVVTHHYHHHHHFSTPTSAKRRISFIDFIFHGMNRVVYTKPKQIIFINYQSMNTNKSSSSTIRARTPIKARDGTFYIDMSKVVVS